MIEELKTRSESGTSTSKDAPSADAINAQLDRILSSQDFQKSKRLSRFLTYIVQETLAGRDDHIKAYKIAIDVFDRPEDFDPIQDPIVRIEAGRLRRTLTSYYLTQGQQDPILIDIPKGAYIPTFSTNTTEPAPSSPQASSSAGSEFAQLDDTPAVVVLPIQYHGSDPEARYFASGLGEEIIVALNQFKELRVISGGLVPESIANNPDIKQLGRVLNVRFVLTGSLRKAANNIRVHMQLVDARSGEQIWGTRYDHEISAENLFNVQDDITQKVIVSIADQYDGIIPRTLTSESRTKKDNLSSYESILRAHHYLQTTTKESYHEARKSLETASNVDPLNARVWALYSEILTDGYTHNFVPQDRNTTIQKSSQAARRAIALDPSCDYAYWALGHYAIVARDKETVINAAESLLKIDPPQSMLALAGWMLAVSGQWDRGLEMLNRQMKVIQFYPGWFHHAFFLDYYRKSDYENALVEANKFNIPIFYWDPIERAAAYGQLGRVKEAKTALDELLALRPDFAEDPRRYLNCYIFQDDLVDRVIEGLNKAGLQST